MHKKTILHFALSIIGVVVFIIYLQSFLSILNSDIIREYIDSNIVKSYIIRDRFYAHLIFCIYGAISALLCVLAGILYIIAKDKQVYNIISLISFISCIPAVLLIGFNILLLIYYFLSRVSYI